MTTKCTACPRNCLCDRSTHRGFCGADNKIRIARVGLHEWEEPCISYGKGSGTVFFSGCSLKCVFCQNHEISSGLRGRDVTEDELCDIFLSVRDMGAANLNLVNPTHYSVSIANALGRVKDKLGIPVVYNTGGYDKVETLRSLEGLVDIYLPDIKYYSSEYSAKYSGASDYFDVAWKALEEMFRQVGYPEFDGEGHMIKGVLPRHLVLPKLYKDSMTILDRLSEKYDVSRLYISIMCQYFPTHRAKEFPELSRRVTTLEYSKVTDYAQRLGITHGYTQERSSAIEEYVPNFDF
ncbi:MAG: radical SAM protein [Clostridia bacterium]|nr:radical SAM protein [Clostridia bacterium]